MMKHLILFVLVTMTDTAWCQQRDASTKRPQPRQEEIASLDLKVMWEPVVTKIVDEIRASLTADQRKALRKFRVDIIPEWDPQGIHAHCSTNERDPRICLTVGDIQGISDLCTGFVLSHKLINDGDWMRKYCLLSRREFKRAQENHNPVRVPSTVRAMGLTPDELDRSLVEESEVYHEDVLRFILAHEICHILDRHEPMRVAGETEADWLNRSKRHENTADMFALTFFRTQNRPPTAMAQLFIWWLILEDDGRLPRYQTHPLTHERLLTISTMMSQQADSYDLNSDQKQLIRQSCKLLKSAARMIGEDAQEVFADWDEEIKELRFEDLRVGK